MIGQAKRLLELQKLRGETSREVSLAPVFAFTSGKGGTGKSFLSINFAYALSQLGQRVLLVDLDSNLSSLNIMLNVYTDNTLLSFLQDKFYLKDLVYNYNDNLDIIFGDSGRSDYPKLTRDKMKEFYRQIKQISGDYDFIFVDTASGTSDEVLAILEGADYCMIVANPEPTAIMDAYVVVKLLVKNNYPLKKLIVINKALDEEDGKTAYQNLRKATTHFLQEEVPHFGSVFLSDEVNRSIRNQEIIIKQNPGSPVSSKINTLAAKFIKIVQMANNNHSR